MAESIERASLGRDLREPLASVNARTRPSGERAARVLGLVPKP